MRKYKGDLNVWLKYVEYCEASGNSERLDMIYPRSMQSRFSIEFCSSIHALRRSGFARRVGKWLVAISSLHEVRPVRSVKRSVPPESHSHQQAQQSSLERVFPL